MCCCAAPRTVKGFGDTIHVCAAAAARDSYVSSLTFSPVAVAVAVAHACAAVACVRVLLPGFRIRRLLLLRAAAATLLPGFCNPLPLVLVLVLP